MAQPVLVLQQDPVGQPGLLARFAHERGHDLEYRLAPALERFPDPRAYAFIIVMGSDEAADDDSLPWLAREMRFLETAFDHDVPTLSICFGAQLVARTMGAPVGRSTRSEIGWHDVETLDAERVPPGRWFGWHGDEFGVPDGAELLARSDVAPQAFAAGPHLGIQFHPEMTPELLAHWLRTWAGERLEELGRAPEDLTAETARESVRSARAAQALFDRWYAHVVHPTHDGKARP